MHKEALSLLQKAVWHCFKQHAYLAHEHLRLLTSLAEAPLIADAN